MKKKRKRASRGFKSFDGKVRNRSLEGIRKGPQNGEQLVRNATTNIKKIGERSNIMDPGQEGMKLVRR